MPKANKFQILPKPQHYKNPSPQDLTHFFNDYKPRAVDTPTDDVHIDPTIKD